MPFSLPILGPMPFGLNAAAAAAERRLGRRSDPYPGFNFLIEIDGLLTGGFTTVTGLEAQLDYKKLRQGGSLVEYPVLEQIRYPPLVLSHGMTDSDALWNWFEEGQEVVSPQRKTVSVLMLDPEQLPIAWWYCKNAYPTKWVGPSLDAGSDAVSIEKIEFEHRGLKMGSLAPLMMLLRSLR